MEKIFFTLCTEFVKRILPVPLLVLNLETFAENKKSNVSAEHIVQLKGIKFTENRGQFVDVAGNPVPHVLYKASGPGIDLYITKKGLTYVFIKPKNEQTGERDERKTIDYEWNTVDVLLKGANLDVKNVEREELQQGHLNFFLGHCQEGIYDVNSFGKLIFKNVYPGIDWVLYNHYQSGFKYDFVVHPGADPSLIRLEYHSLSPANIESGGQVVLKTKMGMLKESAPYSYLKESGRELGSAFYMISKQKRGKVYFTSIGIKIEGINNRASEMLIIDPQLTWCTFYGGNTNDATRTMESDRNGNLFAAGSTASFNLPLQNSLTYFQGTAGGLSQQFIVKFSPAGVMLWATYYGGIGSGVYQNANSLAIDTAGNVFMLGVTNATNFPTQNSGSFYQGTASGVGDATIVKFNNAGTRLWATYYGGSSVEEAYSICSDVAGNIFCVGTTQSTNLPMMNAGTFYQVTSTLTTVGYISKFDNLGNQLWGTLYNGLLPIAATIAPNNDLIITGGGSSSNLILLNPGGGAYFQPTANLADAAIVKFNNGGTLLWSTYFGGNDSEGGRSIGSDGQGNIFIAGITTSTNLPLLNSGGYFQSTIASTVLTIGDVYMTKFNSAGVLLWSTYYGGNDSENFFTYDNLCIDSCGNVFLAFDTKSSNLSTQAAPEGGFRDSVYDFVSLGSFDHFIVRFNNLGTRQWATYYGGDGADNQCPIELDRSGNLYFSGSWPVAFNLAANYPLTNPGGGAYFDNTANGGNDASFTKFSNVAGTPTFSYVSSGISPNSFCQNQTTVAVTGSNLSGGGTFSAAPGLSIHPSTGVIHPENSTPGGYTVSYAFTFTNALCGPTTNIVLTTTIVVLPKPTLSITASSTLCQNSSLTLAVSGASIYSWSTGSQTSSINVTPSVTTVYTVMGTGQNGCAASASTTLTVYPLPSLTVTGGNALCTGGSLTQTVSGAALYNWSTGAQTGTITVNPTVTTAYTVQGTNQNGCSSTTSKTITVFPLPIITISGADTICAGSVVTHTASGASGYTWSTGAQTSIISLSPSASTVFFVTGANQAGCTSSSSHTIIVNALPVVNVFGSSNTVCAGSIVYLSAGGAMSYSWSTGHPTSTMSATPFQTTVYTVTGKSAEGCYSVESFTVSVDACTLLEELEINSGIRIFPNPNSGAFQIESDREAAFILVNQLGQQLMEIKLSKENNFRMKVSGLRAGEYFLRQRPPSVARAYKIIVQN